MQATIKSQPLSNLATKRMNDEIRTRRAELNKLAPAEKAKSEAIITGLETLLARGSAVDDLTHGTSSAMWDGLAKADGRMMTGRHLQVEGIKRRTSEGSAYSSVGG